MTARETVSIEKQVESPVCREVDELTQKDKYGYIPQKKPEHCLRLVLENYNSLCVFVSKKKVHDVNEMITRYEIDGLGGCETQADWRYELYEQRFHEQLAKVKAKKSVVGFNCTERRIVRDQKGGTVMMAVGRFSTFVLDKGVDSTGLGRWCWILVGGPEKKTRITTAYQPCDPGHSTAGLTVWDQHARHFESKNGDGRLPWTILCEDLFTQILQWKENKEELILMGDFNEYVYEGFSLLCSENLRRALNLRCGTCSYVLRDYTTIQLQLEVS